MHYEVKSKLSSTLVQLTEHFFMKRNEQQRNLKDLTKREEKIEQFEYILLVIFFSSVNRYILSLTNLSAFSVSKLFLMLDHTKPSVEKRSCIDVELEGHVGYINLSWNGRVCVGVAFFCLLCACLPSLTTLEWIDQQHFAKTKMGYISLLSDLSAMIIGITSYCVILKMVILHDALKPFRIGFLRYF